MYHSIAAEDYLIEFMGEMYTFEALSNALLKSRILIKNGIHTRIRRERGTDIGSACGQLRLKNAKDKKWN